MITALDRIDELARELNTLRPIPVENQQKLDKKFRLEFNYNSNHLEGNTLTYGETELLLIFDDTKGGHSMREYEEMKAHDVAYQMVEEWARDKVHPLTEQNVKNLNEIILVRPFWKDAITSDGQNTRRQIKVGNYKEYPNSVRLQNGEIFEYASPLDTPLKMQELIDWYRSEENALHPVTLAAMLHYKFVRIHPFDDGNGRVSRLLMNYVLLRNNLPPVIIQSKAKNKYLQALHLADTGDYESFITYIAEQLEWSLNLAIKAAKSEDIEEDDDFSKRLAILEREAKQKVKDKEDKILSQAEKRWSVIASFYLPLVSRLVEVLKPIGNIYDQNWQEHLLTNDSKGGNAVNRQEITKELILSSNEKHLFFKNVFRYPKKEYGIKLIVFSTGFNLEFNKDFYTVSCLDNRKIEYGKIPSQEEINSIVSKFKEEALAKIEDAIKGNNN